MKTLTRLFTAIVVVLSVWPLSVTGQVTYKCVAYCDSPTGQTVIWEPPQIRWVRPSIEGAQMSDWGNIDSRMNQRLTEIAETSYMLISKAQAALKRGDYDAAERLFFAAGQMDPDERDRRDIQEGLQTTRQLRLDHFRGVVLFDQRGTNASPIEKFVKSPPQEIPVTIPPKLQNHPEIQRLIQEETEAYNAFRLVADKLRRLHADKEAGRATDEEVGGVIAEYSRAVDKVAAKRDEIVQRVYVLDK